MPFKITKQLQRYISFLVRSEGFRMESAYPNSKARFSGQAAHAIYSTLSVSNQKYFGSATDSDKKRAYVRSTVEALERYLVDSLQLTSTNGLALHTSAIAAKYNAFYELVERDLYYCHFLAEKPFQKVMDLDELRKEFKIDFSKALEGGLFKMDSDLKGLHGFLVASWAKDFSSLDIGMSAHRNPRDAQLKAIREWMQQFSAPISDSLPPLKLRDLEKVRGIADTLWAARSPEIVKPFIERFFAHESRSAPSKTLYKFKVQLEPIDLSQTLLKNSGLVAYRATSSELQSPFWWLPRETDVNFQRIAHYAPVKLKNREVLRRDLPMFA